MRIDDGKGLGPQAGVNDDNMLLVSAVEQSIEHYINHVKREAYNVYFAVNPDGAGDCFFYLLNDSNKQMDICFEGLRIQTSAAEEIDIYINQTGAAVKTNGADLTPENLNGGSGNIADVTCYGETGDGAVDITGISGGRLLERLWLTDAKSVLFNFEQDIIVPPNQTFSMYAVGGDTLLRGTLFFNFHDTYNG